MGNGLTARTVICTTGTSIAGVPPDMTGIQARISKLKAENDRDEFLTLASAETHSLHSLDLGDKDSAHLLHSQTLEGRRCADEVARIIEEYWGARVSMHEVEGLQVEDPQLFRLRGIPSLFRILERLVRAAPGTEVILNPTGGFKSAVPYITLFGLLEHLRVIYIFERSSRLLELPIIPVEYDLTRFSRARDAIFALERESSLPRKAFFSLIPGFAASEDSAFDYLLEPVGDGTVTLSVFGLHLYDLMLEERGNVFISKRAMGVLESSSGVVREQFEHMLNRMGDRLYRESKIDPGWARSTDLLIHRPSLKRGSRAERAAYYTRSSNVYICDIWSDHDNYVRDAGSMRVADFSGESFDLWIRKPEQKSGSQEPESSESEETETKTAAYKHEISVLRKRLVSMDHKIKKLNATIDDLKAKKRPGKKRKTKPSAKRDGPKK